MPHDALSDELTSPLSFAQERLWTLDRLLPSRSVYNEPKASRLVGRLDVEALQRGLNDLLQRHDVLLSLIHI